MTNKYRVDRAIGRVVPVGMNSIRYIGDSLKQASQVYCQTRPGFTAWDEPDPRYGVLMSKWGGQEYIVLFAKTVDHRKVAADLARESRSMHLKGDWCRRSWNLQVRHTINGYLWRMYHFEKANGMIPEHCDFDEFCKNAAARRRLNAGR